MIVEQCQEDRRTGCRELAENGIDMGGEILHVLLLIFGRWIAIFVEIPEIIAADPNQGDLGSADAIQLCYCRSQLGRRVIDTRNDAFGCPARFSQIGRGRTGALCLYAC